MTPIQRHYEKMMEKAIAQLEGKLADRLGFVSPEAMKDIVQVQQLVAENRLGKKHMEMDLTHTRYLMNNIPFLEYRFFAIAHKFSFAITEIKDGTNEKPVTASSRPLLYDSSGGLLAVDNPSESDSGGDGDSGAGS